MTKSYGFLGYAIIGLSLTACCYGITREWGSAVCIAILFVVLNKTIMSIERK